MKTKNTMPVLLTVLVMVAMLVIAGCSRDNEVELREAETAQARQELLPEGSQLKSSHADQNKILAEIRRATAKYHNIDVAIADGYELDPHCVAHPEFGGMGHHAIDTLKILPAVVPSEPGILVYEPMKNGKYRLVAVEFLVPAAPWDDDPDYDGPPMLGEVKFDDHREMIPVLDDFGEPVLDESGDTVKVNAKGGPPFPHYQLHVWVWKNNPEGMYSPFNPNVSCE